MQATKEVNIELTTDEMAELIVEALIHRGKIKPGNIDISVGYSADISDDTVTITGCKLCYKEV